MKGRVAIIGAGIGGLATSIFLAKEGYKVKVFEKNSDAGGRCGQLIHNGHRFDLGATMLLMPGVYREIFNSLGIDFDRELQPRVLDDLYRIWFDDGSELDFTTDMAKMRSQLEKFEKGSFENAEKYINEGYEFFRIASKNLIGRNFFSFREFATLKNIIMLLKLKTYLSHHAYARKFFSDPHLQMAFTFQNIYVGQSPFESPAFFSMIPAVELREGSYFPKEGVYRIVKSLKAEADRAGVEFSFDREVTSAVVDGNKVKGIRITGGQTVEADIVIANADLPYVYRELLPDRRESRRLEKKKYSCSAMVFHWGLDKKYVQLAHHNVFLSDSFRTGLKVIFRDKMADPHPSFYVHAPARTDQSAAPPGCDTVSVIAGIGHLDNTKSQDWNSFRKMTRKAVIDRLVKAGLTDIEEHIRHEICYNPGTWESVYHVSRGSVFGSLNHSLLQMGYFRPHNRHRKYKNLYFTGGSTHPGNGIPLVLLSAKLTAERILLDERPKK